MVISKISAANTINKAVKAGNSQFKAVLEQKQASLSQQLGTTINQMTHRHQHNVQAIESFMIDKSYSPQKLLAIQYQTGVLLLREQMLCKTVELCTNTFKSFTQMQV